MKIMVNGEVLDATDEQIAAINAAQATQQQFPFSLSKMLLWTRLSDVEAIAVDSAMSAQPPKLRGIWNSASEVRSDSEFFGTLQAFLTAVLGADRAAQLLQSE